MSAQTRTNIIKQLLAANPKATSAVYHTRLDGKILPPSTHNRPVSGVYYHNGYYLIQTSPGVWFFNSWTVQNKRHVINFCATVTPQGQLISGSVNCFGLGSISMDQEYLDIHLEDLCRRLESKELKWDEMK